MHKVGEIKHIIFDLGEVILDIDPDRTVNAFKLLYNVNTDPLRYSFKEQDQLFDDFETGKISSEDFRKQIRQKVNSSISDEDIDNAWNAMLVDVPENKLRLLLKLKEEFQMFVLSNTNDIHIKWVENFIAERKITGGFASFFHHVYYSHIIGYRKPDPMAYRFILEKHELDPSETLFIDDRKENIDSALKMGMKIYHMKNRENFYSLFNDYM